MRKSRYILVFLVLLGIFSEAFAGWGKDYSKEINNCLDKIGKGTAKTITEYVCPAGKIPEGENGRQWIAFQVIMSIMFSELDKKIEGDLKKISESTNKDVGLLAARIDDLFGVSGKTNYPEQYKHLCDSDIKESVIRSLDGKITTDPPLGEQCKTLVEKKMQAYKDSAWLLGQRATVNSFSNDKHSYMRKLKNEYEKFLKKWMTYVSQLSVIKDKWTSKTPKTQ